MENTFRLNDNLIIDLPFRDFLLSSHSRVAVLLKTFETLPGINYLAVTDKIDTISYLPSSKISFVNSLNLNPYSDGVGRIQIKVGRLVSKLLDQEIIKKYMTDSDIETFVNEFKSFFDQSSRKIEVLSGEDIRKYYLYKNYCYPDTGTLWKSCMRYKERQRFLDIYVHNPDTVKMLVMLENQDGVDKVRARALIWEAQDMAGNKVKIMDRIYSLFDSDVYLFKRWANDNGYIPKFYQNAKSQNIFDMNNEPVKMNLKVELKNHNFGTWPYLDSFQFYNISKGVFFNHESAPWNYILIQADGGIEPSPSENEDYDEID
jgi:hypothetical protein